MKYNLDTLAGKSGMMIDSVVSRSVQARVECEVNMLNKMLSELEDQEVYNFYNDFDKKYENISRQNNSKEDKDLFLLLCENSRKNKPWLADYL